MKQYQWLRSLFLHRTQTGTVVFDTKNSHQDRSIIIAETPFSPTEARSPTFAPPSRGFPITNEATENSRKQFLRTVLAAGEGNKAELVGAIASFARARSRWKKKINRWKVSPKVTPFVFRHSGTVGVGYLRRKIRWIVATCVAGILDPWIEVHALPWKLLVAQPRRASKIVTVTFNDGWEAAYSLYRTRTSPGLLPD